MGAMPSWRLPVVQVKFEGPAWAGISSEAKDLIGRLLDRDYNTRITATDALSHDWIRIQCGEDGCILDHDAVDMQPKLSKT